MLLSIRKTNFVILSKDNVNWHLLDVFKIEFFTNVYVWESPVINILLETLGQNIHCVVIQRLSGVWLLPCLFKF